MFKNTINFRFSLLIALLTFSIAHSQTFLSEGFETGADPSGWDQDFISGSILWRYEDGGYTTTPLVPNSRKPPAAYEGNYNALFQYQSINNEATMLITSEITGLELAIKPELQFWHAQYAWDHSGTDYNDRLRVYYKRGADSAWVLLKEYTNAVNEWTERTILLPDSSLNDSYYIGFEGTTNWGWGVCIDNIEVVETSIQNRHIDTITFYQPPSSEVPTRTFDNPLLRIDFKVKGNTSTCTFDSLVIKSLNNDDHDIALNGIKLYATSDENFSNNNLIATLDSFTSGYAIINNIDHDLPTGYSSVWIAVDIDSSATHGDTVDIMLETYSLLVNDTLYPEVTISPSPSKTIVEAIFKDDFESDLGWILTGEFERDAPQGLGGSVGNSDPSEAVSGDTVLGTDLTGLNSYSGDYEQYLTNREYQAISPMFNCKYYKDIKLYFQRVLNADNSDKVYIDYSLDGGSNWTNYWSNSILYLDETWNWVDYDLPKNLEREDSINIRFAVGPTNDLWQLSGWNIDDLFITGDYIANDVGITQWFLPVNGCGHTSADTVKVMVKNFGPTASKDTIPLCHVFIRNGDTTKTIDTLFGSIPFEDSVLFIFSKPADLSTPYFYSSSEAYVQILLETDEYSDNDVKGKELYIVPTCSLPYEENFAGDHGFWHSDGRNSSWEYGIPAGSNIYSPGNNAWVTDLNGNYFNLDSSWIESPCFDFSDVRMPVFECKVWTHTQDSKDGAALFYSIDDGTSWTIADTHSFSWDWNWYRGDDVFALETPGWDSISGGWFTAKQFLPEEVAGQSNVRFRILFESDTNTVFEGIAIDDIKIYEAPVDIGIADIAAPDSACELSGAEAVTVKIVNYSVDTLFTGDTIAAGLDFHTDPTLIDTIVLAADLIPGDTLYYTYSQTVDMSYANKFAFTVYTLHETDNNFYEYTPNNDTITTSIAVYGMPNYDLGPTIGVQILDAANPVLLDAGAGYTSYFWTPGDSTEQTYTVISPGWYYVTVTNSHVPACTAEDSIRVTISNVDLAVTQIYNPVSACELTNSEDIQIQITNYSIDTFLISDEIVVAYTVDRGSPFIDTITLTDSLFPDSTLNHTFDDAYDFETVGDYILKAYTIYDGDLDYTNDTTIENIGVWGYPSMDIGPDTLFTLRADTVSFHPGSEFGTYLWNDGATDSVYNVTSRASKLYAVTVTDIHSCGSDSDAVRIMARNVGVTSIITPVTSCQLSSSESIVATIYNYSYDTFNIGDQIPVSYIFNSTTTVNETVVLPVTLYPLSNYNHLFAVTQDMSSVGSYDIQAFTSLPLDLNILNDTAQSTVDVYGYPTTDLGDDTVFTLQPDTLVFYADAGYDSYLWQDSSTNETYYVTALTSGTYKVTVTNSSGCSIYDSVKVIARDIGITNLLAPSTACILTSSEDVQVEIINTCYDTFGIGDQFIVSYELNEASPVYDTVTLSADFNPGSSYNHTFSNSMDMSVPDTFNFKFSVDLLNDLLDSNNTIFDTVMIHGQPVVDLGPDTILRASEYILNAGDDTSSSNFLWQDSYTGQVYTVLNSGIYNVTVTRKASGCYDQDTVQVTLLVTDISVTDILSDSSECINVSIDTITIEYSNTGEFAFLSGTQIKLGYHINGNPGQENNITLSDIFSVGSSRTHSFADIGMLNQGNNTLKFYSIQTDDVRHSNDTLARSFTGLPLPSSNLGGTDDTLHVESLPTTVSAPAGYSSYLWNTSSTTSSINVQNAGLYWVLITNTNGCQTTDSVYVKVGVKVNDVWDDGSELVIYPNPADRYLHIVISAVKPLNITMQLINSQGQTVYLDKLKVKDTVEKNIDVMSMTKGMYILKVYNKEFVTQRRIIIQ